MNVKLDLNLDSFLIFLFCIAKFTGIAINKVATAAIEAVAPAFLAATAAKSLIPSPCAVGFFSFASLASIAAISLSNNSISDLILFNPLSNIPNIV